jgi:hypothetical protein
MTCLVETGVVDAHPKLLIGLGDDNKISQPPWLLDLSDKVGVKQLFDLFMDEVLSLNRLLPGLLLGRSGTGVDLQMVLNHLPRDLGHLRWLSGKHVNISSKESDEHEYLFAIQSTAMRVVWATSALI